MALTTDLEHMEDILQYARAKGCSLSLFNRLCGVRDEMERKRAEAEQWGLALNAERTRQNAGTTPDNPRVG